MSINLEKKERKIKLKAGDRHYKAYVGPPENYDKISAMQFNLLTTLGLRENDFLLDIGCGSLRGGKLFIPFLLKNRYFGIEPEKWLVEEGIKNEIGQDLIQIKQSKFNHNSDFNLSVFNQKFNFIIAQSIFSHASKNQIVKCLREVKNVMHENSIFVATFVKGINNYSGNKWVYPECVTYTLEFLFKLAKDQGLICRELYWPHPHNQSWLLFIFPGNKIRLPGYFRYLKLNWYFNRNNKTIKNKLKKLIMNSKVLEKFF